MDFAGYNDDDGGGDRFDEAPEQNWLCHGCGCRLGEKAWLDCLISRLID